MLRNFQFPNLVREMRNSAISPLLILPSPSVSMRLKTSAMSASVNGFDFV